MQAAPTFFLTQLTVTMKFLSRKLFPEPLPSANAAKQASGCQSGRTAFYSV
jgi:hypothetical protein